MQRFKKYIKKNNDKRRKFDSQIKSIYAREDIPQITQLKDRKNRKIFYFIISHQHSCSLHPFEPSFFSVSWLYLSCCAFSSIDERPCSRMFSIKCFIFMPLAWKHVISFKIKQQNIFNASMIGEGFLFLINVVCSVFKVFRSGFTVWTKTLKMTFCLAMWIWMFLLTAGCYIFVVSRIASFREIFLTIWQWFFRTFWESAI